jgi:molybdopterin molybdotransferase
MLSVDEALNAILTDVSPRATAAYAPIDAMGLVIAASPTADVDMPPFDKAAVDGYAVKAVDAVAGRSFVVAEKVTAGEMPGAEVTPGHAIEIMTGAPVPASADTLIMLESTRRVGDRIEVLRDTEPGKNICRRGEDARAGDPVLPAGVVLGPQHCALLAGQGCTRLQCHRRPVVAILATGDEIAPPTEQPAPGRIRNANNDALAALARTAHCEVDDLGIAADRPDALAVKMRAGLAADVLLCSGGVSAGTLDLVPDTAKACGVWEVFHHVALQPGRPVFFGRAEHAACFGLPGNPVAAFVCFKVLVEPLLRAMLGYPQPVSETVTAIFDGTFKRSDRRQRYVGVELIQRDGQRIARKVPTNGPADVGALARSHGLAVLPPETGPYRGGETVDVMPF